MDVALVTVVSFFQNLDIILRWYVISNSIKYYLMVRHS